MSASQPAPTPAEDSTALWLLKRRHEELGTMFRAAWDNYIKFYTVFLTFSVAAMGWLLSREGPGPVPKNVDHVVAIVFIAQSVLTAITSASIATYSRRVGREYAEIEKELLGPSQAPSALIGTETIPIKLALWAGWANAAAMIGMSYAWAYIGLRTA